MSVTFGEQLERNHLVLWTLLSKAIQKVFFVCFCSVMSSRPKVVVRMGNHIGGIGMIS